MFLPNFATYFLGGFGSMKIIYLETNLTFLPTLYVPNYYFRTHANFRPMMKNIKNSRNFTY